MTAILMEQHGTSILKDLDVSRETIEDLKWYAKELKHWQNGLNLISPNTVEVIWNRHIIDSAQILLFSDVPNSLKWLDLGSGAGLPGIVVAILLKDRPNASITLVESNAKKCAFLRHCSQFLGLNVLIVNDRLENVAFRDIGRIDIVSARAVKSLKSLLASLQPWLEDGAVGFFHKGEKVKEELECALEDWQFGVKCHRSLTSDTGSIVEIRNLSLKENL